MNLCFNFLISSTLLRMFQFSDFIYSSFNVSSDTSPVCSDNCFLNRDLHLVFIIPFFACTQDKQQDIDGVFQSAFVFLFTWKKYGFLTFLTANVFRLPVLGKHNSYSTVTRYKQICFSSKSVYLTFFYTKIFNYIFRNYFCIARCISM